MDDIQPAAGDFRPHDCPLNCLGLDEIGPGDRVQRRPVFFYLVGIVVPSNQFVQHARRLGVNQQHPAKFLAIFQGVKNGPVIRLPALGRVDHEFLERRTALLDHFFHLGSVAVPIGDGHVKSVVDACFRLRAFEPGVVSILERLLAIRNREVDHGGDAAASRRPGAGQPGVAGDGAAEWQFQVDVNVQSTRHEVFAGGVDDLGPVGVRGQSGSDGGNPLAANGHVGFLRALGADNGAVGDD